MSLKIEMDFGPLERLAGQVRANLAKAVEETAKEVQARAQENAPVDTGFLQGSISERETSPLTREVTVGADYGVHVELGTIHSGAQPFLTPAVEAERDLFEQRIADAFKEATR